MPAIYELNIHGQASVGNYCLNTFKYRIEEGNPDVPYANALAFINAWRTANEAAYAAVLPEDYNILGYTCRRMLPTGGNTAVKSVTVSGTRSGSEQCSGVGPNIAFIADTSTLKSVGHVFLPAVSVDDLVGGEYNGTFVTAVTAFGVALMGVLAGTGFTTGHLVLVHAKTHTYDDVTNILLRGKPTLMNKRLIPVQ